MASNRAILEHRGPQAAIPGHFGNLEVVRVDVTNLEAEFQVRSPDGSLVGPRTATRLSAVFPDSDEDTIEFWKMLVDDLFRVLRQNEEVPDFVKDYAVWIDEDSTGEPALYVRILIKPAHGKADNATVDRWVEFVHLVQDRLMRLRLRRLPYVQVGEWRRRR
jgi:hypothetical protein